MGSPYFASIGYASPLTPVIQDSHPDLPRQRATSLHQDNQRLAGLPSCVTPSLAYYQHGSHAPPTTSIPKDTNNEVRMVSNTSLSMDAPPRAREYQPVLHRLRLTASP